MGTDMGLSRRLFLKRSAAAVAAVPLVGLTPTEPANPKVVYKDTSYGGQPHGVLQDIRPVPHLPTPEMNSLLRRCSDDNPHICMAAQRELAEALVIPMRVGICKKTGLELRRIPDGECTLAGVSPKHAIMWKNQVVKDFDSSADMFLKDARHARWGIVSRLMHDMEDMIVTKINNAKDKDSFIHSFDLFEYPCIHKQKRMGWYCWAEVVVPAPTYEWYDRWSAAQQENKA